jgi:hypothetical protein
MSPESNMVIKNMKTLTTLNGIYLNLKMEQDVTELNYNVHIQGYLNKRLDT